MLPGAPAKFQIRVWDNKGGSVTSWAQALVDGTVAKGSSPVVTVAALGGMDSNGSLYIEPDSTGWTSFNVTIVPEPGAFVLAGFGAVGLLLIPRRK